jgi:hypothetical protein
MGKDTSQTYQRNESASRPSGTLSATDRLKQEHTRDEALNFPYMVLVLVI